MIAAGKLNRKITVQRPGEPIDDGFTTRPGEWEDYITAFASWKASNGREAVQAQGRDAIASGTFWLRYSSRTAAIIPTYSVLHSGKRWQIVGVQEVGRRERIELLVVSDEDDA